ncbi:TRAP transporter small permease subunit [Suttonella sp. R2A3]|uniref:TRAP transporter small permease subunit n=1 Tax=Suttonella sp. R2A3 TaxID=2908648 RepID=UPI001F1F64EC|nr:TRAP transporter small permease subunit [Suttonella sp. R2A3]UJF24122.1 TRAP transporter small permease subunit [Suttonella sp. R2A3]
MQIIVRTIDAVIGALGKAVAWLTLAMVLVTTVIVTMQFFFNKNSIALQESVMYMHATVFMIGVAYALQRDDHVRVDVLYRNFSPRKKALVNTFGTLCFLLPFAVLILWFSWGDAERAWAVMEKSTQPGGLPFVYLLKSLMPLFAILLIVQGFAELLRNLLIFSGKVVLAEEAE